MYLITIIETLASIHIPTPIANSLIIMGVFMVVITVIVLVAMRDKTGLNKKQ